MVLVKPPEGAIPAEIANAATKPVEQQAAADPNNTKDFDDVEAILAGRVSAPPPVHASAESQAAAAAPLAASASSSSGVLTRPDSAIAGKPPPAPPSPPPPTIPQPPAVRYGAWLAVSILAGIGLAVAVVVVSTAMMRSGKPIADAKAKAQSQPPASNTQHRKTPAGVQDDTPKSTDPPATKRAPAPKDVTATPQGKNDDARQPMPPAESSPEGDPLGLVGDSKADKGKAAADASDPLTKFADVLGEGNADPMPPAAAPAATAVPTTESAADEPPPARPSLPRPEPREVDVEARLADPLPAIDSPGVPLADFLEILSSLSTVPITLDPQGLALVGASAESPVSLKLDNTTVGQALAEGVKTLRLEHAVQDDQVIVGLSAKLYEAGYPMEDLTNKDQEQAQQLAQWATALIHPEAWAEGDEEGASLTPGAAEFAVTAPARTHAELLFLFEKLRVARGLAPKSKLDPALFRLATKASAARDKLAAPITLNYSQPTLLTQILGKLEDAAKVRILVNWRALAAEGWNADGETTLVVADKSLGEALDALLAPMDLAWRVIDSQTLEVTSPSALAAAPEVEFHSALELADTVEAGEALLTRLATALEAETDESPLRFDPGSGYILASAPQPRQRQIERLLQQWRGEERAAAR